jgi:hypothetical protein
MEPVVIGPMNRVVKQLRMMERDLSERKGGFLFFGLTLPEERANLWQVVMAAPWIVGHQRDAIHFIHQEMDKYLTQKESFDLSLNLLRCDDPGLDPIHEALEIQHGLVEVFDVDLFRETMRRAYIITSQRLEFPVALSED